VTLQCVDDPVQFRWNHAVLDEVADAGLLRLQGGERVSSNDMNNYASAITPVRWSELEVMHVSLETKAPPSENLQRYPRLCSHIIAESLGYATPLVAATILQDARLKRENWSEWIYSRYSRDAGKAVAVRMASTCRPSRADATGRFAAVGRLP